MTAAEYLQNVQNYSTKDISIEFLLHIPSLRNNDQLFAASNEELLSYFMKKAKVPVFHFQKTYMRQIYDFICEYIFKKDYSVKAEVAQSPINYDVKTKILISDLISIFSDFDYNNMSLEEDRAESFYRNSVFGSKLPDDPYSSKQILENYNGLIVSLENFFIMTKMEAIHLKTTSAERMKFRIGDAESR